ncbi:MAG: hypothetical protein VKK42_23835 [Lyngbya sp.]|nr:hypothetical protein [Lyngbya sp.]
MVYKQLFELSIFHNYYRSQVCPDLSIEPTPECRRILSGYRLILKNKVNGIVVIAPVDSENQPQIELADNLKFTFLLKLKNKTFLDFTEIDWKPVEDSIYQYSNQKNTQIGQSNLEKTKTKLLDIKLPKGKDILGIVDIYNNSSLPKVLTLGSEYKITFQAKKQHWFYYLITDSVTQGDEFLIQDQDTTRETEIKFTRLKNTEAEKKYPRFSALNQQYPQSQKYIFKSDSEITCQEAGIKNLQLLNQKNSNGGNSTVWIEHLPNPPNHNGIYVINALKSL